MLLTFSAPPAKGSTVTVDLDKTELLTHDTISGDSFWSVSSNIRVVVITFTSTNGDQDLRLRFDFSQATPSASMPISLKARSSDFNINRIILSDFDNGELIMGRDEIVAYKPAWSTDHDFTLT